MGLSLNMKGKNLTQHHHVWASLYLYMYVVISVFVQNISLIYKSCHYSSVYLHQKFTPESYLRREWSWWLVTCWDGEKQTININSINMCTSNSRIYNTCIRTYHLSKRTSENVILKSQILTFLSGYLYIVTIISFSKKDYISPLHFEKWQCSINHYNHSNNLDPRAKTKWFTFINFTAKHLRKTMVHGYKSS